MPAGWHADVRHGPPRGGPSRDPAAAGRRATDGEERGMSATAAELFLGWDHLEFWVGNARQAAAFLASGFGFDIVAYAGPETGMADRASYVLDKGSVRFVVTGALSPSSPISAHVRAHGDGVRDVA